MPVPMSAAIAKAEADLASAKDLVRRLEEDWRAAKSAMLRSDDQLRALRRQADLMLPLAVVCMVSRHEGRVHRYDVCIVWRTKSTIWTRRPGEGEADVARWRQRQSTQRWEIFPYSVCNHSWLEVAE